MAKRTILVDSARRELEKHGTETFPMTVNHDDLWSFEGKNVPIHWHNDLEINLIREGEAVFQVYQKSYRVRTGEGFLLNRNVPHSCSSPGNEHVRYSTILVRPDFLYGDFGSDVERKCFQPFLQNSAIPCIYLTGSGAFVKRSLLPPFQKNDRQNYHRISGRIPCQQKLFAGAEWTVFYDTDHRNGGIQ